MKFIVNCSLLQVIILLAVSCNDTTSSDAPAVTSNKAVDSAGIVKKAMAAIAASKLQLQDGDLVTRSDDDFESLTLQNFSKQDRAYSHAGIVFKEDSGFVVYHSMTGIENPSGNVRRDAYDSFVNPVKKTGFGIFHYQLSEAERAQLHKVLQRNHASKLPFDVTFNLNSNDSMYCSEMIYKSLKEATRNRVTLPVSAIENFKPKILGYKYNKAFFKKFEYIGIDDLYLNQFCKEVIRVKY